MSKYFKAKFIGEENRAKQTVLNHFDFVKAAEKW